MKRIWKERLAPAGEEVRGLLDKLLAGRGLADSQEIENFLNASYENLHDPHLLKDMDRAAARIEAALQGQEKITIYADYDADAVTAAAVCLRFFQHAGYQNVDYYIPDRMNEGYGMNMEAVEELARRGTNLIITVDCGINAFDSALRARELGVDLIITDHHQLTGGLPGAVAVINPHRPDDSYPCRDLTGVGVAFKLIQALTHKLPTTLYPLQPGFEKWLLDLVAIGTVADCQSLLRENRILVKWGLYVMQKTRWMGLKKLLAIAGIGRGPYDTYQVGFMIAPRINAAGRIDHADIALRLLLTDDELQAERLAEKLDELNRHRQNQTERILSEAREQIVSLGDKKILLAAGEGWHRGIVGLVAGKLTEEFYRPVLVMEKGQSEATGSARSIANFNIVEAIGSSRDILVKYGGHLQAAGFTLRSEHIDLFHKNLLSYAENNLSNDDLSPTLYYDAEITLPDITAGLLELLAKFEPFGMGNPRPKFRLNNITPKFVSQVGKEGKHLRFMIDESGLRFSCIGFNMGYWTAKFGQSSRIDLICEPQYNEWNGEKKIQLKIVDISLPSI